MRKKAPLTVERKNGKGGFRFPPFAIPLKRPRKGLCPLPWNHPRRNRKISDFHMSNICRAETFPYTKLNAPPAGRFVYARSNDTTQKRNNMVFQARQRDSASPAPFFSPFFSGKTEKNGPSETHRAIPAQKRYGPRSGGIGAANRTAPSAHPKCAVSCKNQEVHHVF